MKDNKHVGFLIKCLDKKIVQQLNKELEPFELTVVQHEVLAYIEWHKETHEVYQKEIEAYLGSTNPTVTGIVKRLEAKGLLQREAGSQDARCKKLVLTEKGSSVLKETMKLGPLKIEKRLTKDLKEEELEQLAGLLNKVLKSLEHETSDIKIAF